MAEEKKKCLVIKCKAMMKQENLKALHDYVKRQFDNTGFIIVDDMFDVYECEYLKIEDEED